MDLAARAEDLERHLGDPGDGDAPFSWRRILAADEAEEFPAGECRALDAWGYPAWLVPAACGGELRGFDELLVLGRLVARRDLTAAIATGQSLLGALPVWIAGGVEQKARLARSLLSGGAGCLALTEEAHGSDLAGGEVAARPAPGGGFALDGTKWCINNATRGDYLSLLARTDPAGGLHGFSVFFVEKGRVPRGLSPIPRLRTHGLRGADISGMAFERAELPADALVGREGRGLELILKVLQVSRTLCGAFSLGAGDTGLRLALDFILGRRLYGAGAFEIPVVRRALLDAFADLLAAECVARAGARALSCIPGQMSVASAVVKVVVPELVSELLRECATLLGARHYLRDGPAAPFQKVLRDHALVGLFDGSTSVNLYVIAGQLARMAEARGESAQGPSAELFDLGRPAPPFDWSALKTSSRGRDDLLNGVEPALARGGGPELIALGKVLLAEREALDRAVLSRREERQDSPALFALARRHCWLAAAACCLQVALSTRAPFAGAGWAARALGRLLARARARDLPEPRDGDVEAALLDLHRERRLFSLMPVRLGGAA